MNEYDKLFITTTDTIVGIGGIVSNEVLDALYSIKNRPREKKIIILVSSIDQAQNI
ncbi:Sua5/YciO/YrdC/YwlC family protein [Mycoplasmopsis cynos]|uniref:Sua5/YciO/YrdC/YwlC family protein n=1 Tax=Mycoplasmopsis cynos TaxID=171284 RepID=UPI0024CB53CE|nr:Sua5/YciO/YrdC/YwlC family protein [Mycoplasmopsis cynos]WAM09467.1 Sua5/YciO/YrdC/YwlC family protein [Mycoplasmopsis cynos]